MQQADSRADSLRKVFFTNDSSLKELYIKEAESYHMNTKEMVASPREFVLYQNLLDAIIKVKESMPPTTLP